MKFQTEKSPKPLLPIIMKSWLSKNDACSFQFFVSCAVAEWKTNKTQVKCTVSIACSIYFPFIELPLKNGAYIHHVMMKFMRCVDTFKSNRVFHQNVIIIFGRRIQVKIELIAYCIHDFLDFISDVDQVPSLVSFTFWCVNECVCQRICCCVMTDE